MARRKKKQKQRYKRQLRKHQQRMEKSNEIEPIIERCLPPYKEHFIDISKKGYEERNQSYPSFFV
ncbi:hypothetical protein CSV75_15935 [Sporosarcina sp. P18a]|uniref:hypothetical protein n=1 Tax=Bacillus sp. M6-12 TaxID=2054166 RepID=UPI000C1662D1|nr:hypothetical protein [Bacillus sp. M6-12]PIC78632.1 hypothetical protein CSV75_15935 [Sporosarcina sp. P18a]PLS14579.1 hypothetical protein CVD28_27425 [Bacillus sp. M6-12]